MIIENNETVLGLLSYILEKNDYDITATMDGREGIDLYHQQPFDLVITDIHLGQISGLEVMEELKKSFSDLKLIAISGGASRKTSAYLKQCLNIGAIKTFRKPFDIKELLNMVKRILG